MRVLVTGGAGFIGSHVVELLLREGHDVTVLDNFSSGKEENLRAIKSKISIICADILDENAIRQAVSGQDYVFHLAAIASVPVSIKDPLKVHEVNATGTLKVLLAAKDAGVKRVIYSSTAAAYGDEPTLPKKETSVIKPLSPYALSKLAGEQYALMFTQLYGLPTTCLRYFNVYGPRQDPKSPYSGVISKFIDLVKAGQAPTIFGDGKQTRDFIFVEDVARANLRAMKSNVNGVFNVATGKQVSLLELLEAIAKICDKKVVPKFGPAQAGDIKHSVADVDSVKDRLKFSAQVSLSDGLAKTIRYI